MEDENRGCEGRQEERRRGWRQYVCRVDLCKYVCTYVHMYTAKIHLHVQLYIRTWLCVVRGPSVRPLTIEHNSGVAVNASHHITDLHPVRLVGVEVTVTTVTGVSETHSGRGHTYIPHTITHYCNTVRTTPMYIGNYHYTLCTCVYCII